MKFLVNYILIYRTNKKIKHHFIINKMMLYRFNYIKRTYVVSSNPLETV